MTNRDAYIAKQKKLKEECPKLFRSMFRERGPEERKIGGGWSIESYGFECGEGWFDLLAELSRKIEAKINELPEDKQEVHFALQVKEKFGGLRFYMSISSDEIYELISEAEKVAAKTCELSGSAGKLVSINGRVLRTLSESEIQKLKDEGKTVTDSTFGGDL